MNDIQKILEDPFLDLRKSRREDVSYLRNYVLRELEKIKKQHFLVLCSYQKRQLLDLIRRFYQYESRFLNYDSTSIRTKVGEMIEEYIYNDILSKDKFNSCNEKLIYFEKNNTTNKMDEDVKIVNTELLLDIKSNLAYYVGNTKMDNKNALSLSVKQFLRYYNKIINRECEDIWLMTFYQYEHYKHGIELISIKRLMEYLEVNGENIVVKEHDVMGCHNIFEGYRYVDVISNNRIMYDTRICISYEAFRSYLIEYY